MACTRFTTAAILGLVLATLASIGGQPDDLHLWEQDWVNTLVPQKGRVEKFRGDYLLLFSLPQREAVASYLELFNRWHLEKKGYRDEEIERAGSQVWRGET